MDTESPLIHYLDNLLTMGQADSSAYYNHLPMIKEVCPHLSIFPCSREDGMSITIPYVSRNYPGY